MTTDRDFDRLTRAWLDLMPTEAPNRTIASVLQAVDATPQVRWPWRRPIWRPHPMKRLPFAVAVGVVALAGIAVLSGTRSGPSPSVGGSPAPVIGTPLPSAPASAPPGASSTPVPTAGAAIPEELLATWMGAPSQFVLGDAGSAITFTADTLVHAQSNELQVPLLSSSASAIGPDRVRLESSAGDGCATGDVGTYAWSLSASGETLTITADSDTCMPRSETLVGTWWKVDCRHPQDPCLGNLDAGTYASQFIEPRVGTAWAPNFGALTYTVPEGWANLGDWPGTFSMTTAADYAGVRGADDAVATEIKVLTRPQAIAGDADCSAELAPGVDMTVDDLAAWVRQIPGLDATEPTAIEIDGHAARWLDLVADPDGLPSCGEVQYLQATDADAVWIGPDDRQRLILADLGEGHVVAILITTSDAARFEDFVTEAMTIISTFRFE